MTPSDVRGNATEGDYPLTRPSVRSITRALEERSTAHGLPNLNKARGTVTSKVTFDIVFPLGLN